MTEKAGPAPPRRVSAPEEEGIPELSGRFCLEERGDAPPVLFFEGEPAFDREPALMLEAAAAAAIRGAGWDSSLAAAVSAAAPFAAALPPEEILFFWKRIIAGPSAGKALFLMKENGLLEAVAGNGIFTKLSRREEENFRKVAEGIGKTRQDPVRRLGLFYTIFDGKRGRTAIANLPYDEETRQHLSDAVTLLNSLFFLTHKYELKQFMARYGKKRYQYLDNLSKAARIVYGHDDAKILARKYILDDILRFREPIFVEDLAISRAGLEERGAGREEAERILNMLLDVVHIKPGLNTEEELLRCAESFRKNKLAAAFRKLKWIR